MPIDYLLYSNTRKNMKPYFILVLCFIQLTGTTTPSTLPSSQPRFASAGVVEQPQNDTVYRVSKQICWGCVGESLQFLYAQNLVRAAKLELPLMWDSRLERYARWWAAERKSDCKAEHSFPEGGFKLGENIFWGSGDAWTPSDAVRAWAEEERYYSYENNSCQEGRVCGHYTQIVWRDTRRVGCARIVCDDGDVFMTCNYDPVGNYVGQRPY